MCASRGSYASRASASRTLPRRPAAAGDPQPIGVQGAGPVLDLGQQLADELQIRRRRRHVAAPFARRSWPAIRSTISRLTRGATAVHRDPRRRGAGPRRAHMDHRAREVGQVPPVRGGHMTRAPRPARRTGPPPTGPPRGSGRDDRRRRRACSTLVAGSRSAPTACTVESADAQMARAETPPTGPPVDSATCATRTLSICFGRLEAIDTVHPRPECHSPGRHQTRPH